MYKLRYLGIYVVLLLMLSITLVYTNKLEGFGIFGKIKSTVTNVKDNVKERVENKIDNIEEKALQKLNDKMSSFDSKMISESIEKQIAYTALKTGVSVAFQSYKDNKDSKTIAKDVLEESSKSILPFIQSEIQKQSPQNQQIFQTLQNTATQGIQQYKSGENPATIAKTLATQVPKITQEELIKNMQEKSKTFQDDKNKKELLLSGYKDAPMLVAKLGNISDSDRKAFLNAKSGASGTTMSYQTTYT